LAVACLRVSVGVGVDVVVGVGLEEAAGDDKAAVEGDPAFTFDSPRSFSPMFGRSFIVAPQYWKVYVRKVNIRTR
jgi:hypothetical protein